ncbi:recombinase family protein [Anaerosporobacter sp.]|uniref:recombinase family protein n=1 Tax=Anaerosporobacter sp. TaxID=1872529 RepID=UPI00286F8386|nr:recombinase family protein [Anaerosporobacter sp.]
MNYNLQVINLPQRMRAVGFVKSRKSYEKIHEICRNISRVGFSKRIYVSDFIVDETAGTDIDRSAIDRLVGRLEYGDVECVMVNSVFDITRDVDDLAQFFWHLNQLDCKLYSIEEKGFIPIELEDEE